jgi:MoaA/NifB/PqqE/SkfB family radical SAM enzyme
MSQNNLDKIYNEFGANICLLPFLGAFYQTNNLVDIGQSKSNSVRPCCQILHNDKFDITGNTIEESRNTIHWKELRKGFIESSCHDIADCIRCSNPEKINNTETSDSTRIRSNRYLADHLEIDIIKEVNNIIRNDYHSDKIVNLDYFPSNYCNYECIMCSGSSSTSRMIFESKYFRKDSKKIQLNPTDSDFYTILQSVETINFTGGETILQPQVHEIIDYLVDNDLAKNISLTLVTNASKWPDIIEKFKKFKGVFYTISLDGIGDVIEYQRRGAVWAEVEINASKIWNTFGSMINYVVTAINVFSVLDFLSWIEQNNISRVIITPVFNIEKLSVAVIPPELKNPLIEKLEKYQGENIDRVLEILRETKYDESLLPKFVEHIRREDRASKRKLVDVVPEWKPYFEN